MNSVKPSNKEMRILVEGFFGQPRMIAGEWVNWAIGFTGSPLPTISDVTVFDLTSYYDYCKVLQIACIKYLASVEGTI